MSVELRVRGLRAGYGPVEVLHGVDLDFPAGRVTLVLGRNGAGKTTLLRTIAGLLPARRGRVQSHGVDVTGWPAYRRARAGVLLIPDDRGVFADLTVEENLALFGGGASAAAAFEAFPVLRERRRQRAGTLSGGEQQMLALSRALVRRPRVLLVDELSRGLAAPVTAELYGALASLARSGEVAVVLVEQDAAAVLPLAQVAYVLSRGSVGFAGEPADLSSGAAQLLSSSQGTS